MTRADPLASMEKEEEEVPTIEATKLQEIIDPVRRRLSKYPIQPNTVDIDNKRFVAGCDLKKGDTVALVPVDGVNIAGALYFYEGDASEERVGDSRRTPTSQGPVCEVVSDAKNIRAFNLVGHLIPHAGRRMSRFAGKTTLDPPTLRSLIRGYYVEAAKVCNCAYVTKPNGVVAVVAMQDIPKGKRLCVARGAIPTIFRGKPRDGETVILLMVQAVDDKFIEELLSIPGVAPFLEAA